MATTGLDRPEILKRAQQGLLGGLAYCQKRRGMAIVDRKGQGYEVVFVQVESHTAEALALGTELFGRLKITDTQASLLPSTAS